MVEGRTTDQMEVSRAGTQADHTVPVPRGEGRGS